MTRAQAIGLAIALGLSPLSLAPALAIGPRATTIASARRLPSEWCFIADHGKMDVGITPSDYGK